MNNERDEEAEVSQTDESIPESEEEQLDADESASHESMDALMDQYLNKMAGSLETGRLLRGPILEIKPDNVLVDIGEKAEGVVPYDDLLDHSGKMPFKKGDVIDVIVRGQDRESGLVMLSHSEARRRAAFGNIEESLKSGTPLRGEIVRAVKGGLIVDVGTTAFLPASQVDLRRVDDFEPWIGKTIECVVLEFEPQKRRIVLSRRKLLEERQARKLEEVLKNLKTGDLVEVEVKRLVDFGAFADLGDGVVGLIPRGEISWQRNARPENHLKPGDRVEVKIIDIDRTAGKITFSRRQVLPDPWESAAEKYPPGSKVEGDVVSLTNYGAFVRLEEGLDGLVHISDMAWDSQGKRPADYVAVKQRVEVSVLKVETGAKRISLGMKQLTPDPWGELERRYAPRTKLKGKVTGIRNYGAFVEIEPGIEGMIHVSDFSWERRIEHPSDVVSKGDEIEVCVLSIDRERRRVSLGVKQLSESPLLRYSVENKTGSIVEGEIVNLTEFGAFISLAESVEGFIHVSQLDRNRVESPMAAFNVGDKITAEITKIDLENGKVALSRRLYLKNTEKRTVTGYMKQSESGGANLGELLANLNLEDDLPPE